MESRDRPTPHQPAPDREIELRVAVHADGRQIVVRRFTEVDERSGRRTLHIDAVVK